MGPLHPLPPPRLLLAASFALAATLSGGGGGAGPRVVDAAAAGFAFPNRGGIARDERVVFFPTAARRVVVDPPLPPSNDDDGGDVDDAATTTDVDAAEESSTSTPKSGWEVPVHGWIFEPEERSLKRRALVSLLRKSFDLDRGDEASEVLKRRLRPFLVDNERGKTVSIKIGETMHKLPRSKANGHFRTVLRVEDSDMPQGEELDDGRLVFEAVTRKGDERTFTGESFLVDETGLSVVSDIDDTVKLSNVLDKKTLIRNTFLKEFESVPGMAEVYRRWADERGARFHFVSSSPWQLFEDLRSFLTADGFPAATFHLKFVRLKDRTVLNLLKDPKENKVRVIESILKSYPQRKFVLVGDTGEKDPEVYGEVARQYPTQVLRIFLRNVTEEVGESARFSKAFAGVSGSKWSLVGDDPVAEMQLPPPDTCAPGI